MIRAHAIVVSACCLASAAVAAESVTKLDTISDWTLYADDVKPHKFCFVSSEPKSTDPADTARDAPRAYVSAWPKDGIKAELSFRLGFPAKKGAEISASVAPAGFQLFASDDRAFVKDATQELKLLDAMKKGQKLTLSSKTQTGVAVSDVYSLNGLGGALQKLQEACFSAGPT